MRPACDDSLPRGAAASAARTIDPKTRFDFVENPQCLTRRLVLRPDLECTRQLLSRLTPAARVGKASRELEMPVGIRWPERDRDSELLDRLVAAARIGQGFAEQQSRAGMVRREVHRLLPQEYGTPPHRVSDQGVGDE